MKGGRLSRRVVLVPTELWQRLRSVLALRGETVSGWFRAKATEELKGAGDGSGTGSGNN